jgi:hypothetical protein
MKQKQISLFFMLGVLVLVSGCVRQTKPVIVGKYTVIRPSADRWERSAEKIPRVPSGVAGVSIDPQCMFTSLSHHSAVIISSVQFDQAGGAAQSSIETYAARMYESLQLQGKSTLSQYENGDNKIKTIITDRGSVFTVKNVIFRTSCQDGLIIDFIFTKDEYKALQQDMIALLNHVTYREE